MIIVDLQQVSIASLVAHLGPQRDQINEDILRHMILNSLRSIRKKLHGEYGEMVIATDSRMSWRRDRFQYYKANRKKGRDESFLDWGMIFGVLDELREDIKEYFPYPVIHVEGAEADDVIGALCEEHCFEMNVGQPAVMIVSGDKDFRQLHKFHGVRQYDPTRKKMIQVDDPAGFLREHILRGDAGDGIPNILSDDDVFVTEHKRQHPLTAKKLKALKETSFSEWETTVQRNWDRNSLLIDLGYTPLRIKSEALYQYDEQKGKGRDRLLTYFIKKRLKNLTEVIGDF